MSSHLNAANSSELLVGKTLLLYKGSGPWLGSAGSGESPDDLCLLQTNPQGGSYLRGPGKGGQSEEGLCFELSRNGTGHKAKENGDGRE